VLDINKKLETNNPNFLSYLSKF